MNKRWKEELINELIAYKKSLESFEEVWCKGKIAEIYDKLEKRRQKIVSEREELFNKAEDFYKLKLKNVNNEEDKKKINRKISALKKERDDQELNNMNNFIYKNLERGELPAYIKNYMKCVIDGYDKFVYETYTNMMQMLGILGVARNDMNLGLYCPIDDSFSKFCQEEFRQYINPRNNTFNYEPEQVKFKGVSFLDKKLFDYGVCHVADINKVGYMMPRSKESSFSHLNLEVLECLIKDLQENSYESLMDFCKKVLAGSGIEISKSFVRFKRLYEETPEEIMISDQRYYSEKKLEQDKEDARLARLQMERDAERQRMLEERALEMEEEAREREYELQREYQQEMLEQQRETMRFEEAREREYAREQENAIRAQKEQTRAIYDSQLAQMKSEFYSLDCNSLESARRRAELQVQIRNLENKRNNI